MKTLLCTLFSILSYQVVCYGQDTIRHLADTSEYTNEVEAPIRKRSEVISYAAPALMLSYGFLSLESKSIRRLDRYISCDLLDPNRSFTTEVDDYLRYIPVLAVYSLNAFGIKGKNNFIDRSALYLVSNLLLSKSVDFLKDKTHRLRPSNTDFRAFPSGHAALAFAAAEYMRLEYKDVSVWYGYAAYAGAAATGTIKIIENAHWLSDVLAGAGVGILSTKVSYLVYPWGKEIVKGRKNLEFRSVPYIGKGVVGVSVTLKLK